MLFTAMIFATCYKPRTLHRQHFNAGHNSGSINVMWAVGIERVELRGVAATGVLQYPRVLFTAVARAARARESQPQGIRPRPGKR